MVAEVSEYKGNPILTLTRFGAQDKYPMRFGLNKARLILEHLEDIKKFVEENKREE